MSTTITDRYDDTLVVEESINGEEYLYVTATVDEGDDDIQSAQIELDRESVTTLRDLFNKFLGSEFDWGSEIGPNEAKLRLAAEYGLKVKFAYAGERDYRAVERRLVPEEVYVNHDHVLVGGESFDQGGVSEGYRQFRLDRISGEVVVR